MTALKWITTEAKKLRKQYPKRFATWREYVAQASAIYASKHKGKSPVGKKHKVGAVKKAAKKSPVKSEYHKDTKSHNVNIRVMSGVKVYGNPENILKEIEYWQKQVDKLRAEYKSERGKIYKKSISQDIRMSKRWLEKYKRDLKNYLTKLK